ncbi:hypothetical protein PR003_g16081 [Phytophthora rubi]|uniref:Uncharacterized protein n=1 Tax=Phytophthora rubi TaxID=129364 RepID=A0A6A3KYB5_9STRA|nr:hypothetical protein PR002_g15830 [Phytophthora rubi]KAE9013639.1 hypothetical protein PR001_g15360 [Phytophthora rubi]KAE9327137.1 hypothetical protein PR003_g16081 [Phytophthora rubi]
MCCWAPCGCKAITIVFSALICSPDAAPKMPRSRSKCGISSGCLPTAAVSSA